MSLNNVLSINQVVSNQDIQEIFLCGNMGGMRKSNKTNTLVLISDYTKNLYEDRWADDILHYTGMGKTGDQELKVQNRVLFESKSNGISIHLFEVFLPCQYTYRGKVYLADSPYQEEQPDENGKKRKVWMFPLKLLSPLEIDEKSIIENERFKKKNIRNLSDEELLMRAIQTQSMKPSKRACIISKYISSEYISEYVKRRADGICELCLQSAPFYDKDGRPYLESYRIKKLSDGGADTIENTAALCPNCRTKLQILNSMDDKDKLKQAIKAK